MIFRVLTAIFLSAALVSPQFATDGPLFQDRVFPIGAEAWDSAQNDFNEDGHVDLIAPSEREFGVTVLLGRGDGTFAPATIYDLPGDPRGVAVGDFNGDTKVDFVVALWEFYFFAGNGDGTFEPAVISGQTTHYVWPIEAGDFNEDGNLDLVYGAQAVYVTFGNGDGTFAAPLLLDNTDDDLTVAVGHFNTDEHLDIAAHTNSTDPEMRLRVFAGDGEGAFSTLFDVGQDAFDLTAYDLDGDGVDELIGAFSVDLDPGNLWVRWSDDGSLQVFPLLTRGPLDIEVGDLDGDSFVDIAVAIQSHEGVNVLFGNGPQSFEPSVEVPSVQGSGQVEIADFDEDGYLDVGVASWSGGSFYPLFGSPDRSFRPGIQAQSFEAGGWAALADLNEDGLPDIVSADPGSNELTRILTDGAGGYQPQPPLATGNVPRAIVTGLIDDDTHFDVATIHSDTQDVWVYSGLGDGVLVGPKITPVAPDPLAATVADFDDDGALDLAILHSTGYTVRFGTGDGFFEAELVGGVGTAPQQIAAGQLNGDALEDLVVTNSGSQDLSLIFAIAPGLFAREVRLPLDISPISVGVADVDRDGIQDIVLLSWGEAVILRGQGDGGFQEMGRVAGVGWVFKGSNFLSDFDGDGRLDLVARSSDPNSWVLKVWTGDGHGGFEEEGAYAVSQTPGVVLPLESDGDGRLDLAVTQSDFVSVLLNVGPKRLSFAADKATLGWPEMRDALGYYVYRGLVSQLIDTSGDGLPDAGHGSCLLPAPGGNEYIDESLPAAGEGWFYLRSVLGPEGEYGLGSTSSDQPRVPAEACPQKTQGLPSPHVAHYRARAPQSQSTGSSNQWSAD